jgi:hypothetical protein
VTKGTFSLALSVNHTSSRQLDTRESSERGDEVRIQSRPTPYSRLVANLAHPARSKATAIGLLAASVSVRRGFLSAPIVRTSEPALRSRRHDPKVGGGRKRLS